MPSPRDHLPTTEQHQPPSLVDTLRGKPTLFASFPAPAVIPIPRSGDVVGRAWLADLGITDTEISGRHARFFRTADVLHVEDLGSRNGTWIGGKRIPPGERVRVNSGDVVRLGRTLFVYRDAY